MKKFGILTIVAICSLLFVASMIGCSSTGSGGTNTVYFPLTDGYSWVYSTQQGSSITTQVQTVEGTKQISSTITASKVITLNSSGSTSEAYLKATNDGVFSYGGSSSLTTEASTQLSYPLTVGKTWANGSAIAEVISIDTTVIVPAGTFANCAVVTIAYGYNATNLYLAPNVGLVRMNGVYNGTIMSTMELTSKNF